MSEIPANPVTKDEDGRPLSIEDDLRGEGIDGEFQRFVDGQVVLDFLLERTKEAGFDGDPELIAKFIAGTCDNAECDQVGRFLQSYPEWIHHIAGRVEAKRKPSREADPAK